MKKSKEISKSPFLSFFLVPIFFLLLSLPSNAADNGRWEGAWPEVKRADERKSLLKTEYGEISAVDFHDGSRFGHYHLQFITMEPNSLFLPVLVHADMVFYIHTGSGRLNWIDDDDLREVNLRRGDIYRLHPGSIFYLQSSLEPEREKLRVYALFSSTDDDSFDPAIGAYSSITDLVRGFDKKALLEAFMAPEEVIEEIMNGTKPPLIVHAVASQSKKKLSSSWELEARFLKGFLGESGASGMVFNKKKKKGAVYNVYEANPDFKNCNGWSLAVTKKASHQLKGSNIGLFVVNLTSGSMMGPHWNRRAWEIGIVTSDDPGVVHVGCSSTAKNSTCKSSSFVVGKGDVFVVPRFSPMAQMSFNNGTFAFVGFSTTNRHTQPQFLAGSSSVLQMMDREVLAWSFDVNVTTIDRLLGARVESVILGCSSCAEEEVMKMEERAERERQEEERRRREEEEERKRQEEEEKRRREEEEERKRQEEEERRRREEEEEEERRRREEEEERKREEEEERRREEEEERKRQEEEARKREEEEERKREEEEARKREKEEEMKREEEEARKREEEEERKREEEEEARKEEEEARKEEERKREEEEARKREEEEEARKEEERKREEKEARKEEEEETRKEEEERKREQEKERKREEEEEEEEEEGRGRRRERREAERRERGEREAEREEEEAREGEESQQKRRWKRHKEAEREEEERQRRRGSEEEEPVIRILSQWT